ncbi:MAG: co-chaperone DjlA [Steroidobacteraceae bacterium]|nr:co-chaperone DjlA [Steroidobacteraceae bacterium]
MNWIGKLVGAVIGAATGLGVAGALVGIVIGHAYDEKMSGDDDAPNRDAAGTRLVFFRATFTVMGHAAKADGRVSEREILAARQVFRHLHLGEAETREAMDCFTRGKATGFDLGATLAELRKACGGRHDLLRYFLDIQMRTALLGNDLQGPVRPLLMRVAQALGISGFEFAHMEAILRMQGFGTAHQYSRAGGEGGGPRGARPQAGALADAYEILEVKPDCTEAELKKAYRRQMSQNHPDKLLSRGLPESMLEIAKEKTQAIQAAYERIKEARGIN